MSGPNTPGEKGSLMFFAAWLLLHEKADDWIRDALRRARETPDDLRGEYERFLVSVEAEKEAMKGILHGAVANEIRQMGFTHKDDAAALRAEIEDLRSRIRGLEDKLERIAGREQN